MASSFSPTVDTTYPGDHTMFSFQYTFSNHLYFFRSRLALWPLSRPITSLTAYFGGMIIIVWIWSTWICCSAISTPGICRSILGHIRAMYSFIPGFRMRLRYFGIHTTWYSVRYTVCPDSLFSTIHKFIPIYLRGAFTHGQARGTLRGIGVLHAAKALTACAASARLSRCV